MNNLCQKNQFVFDSNGEYKLLPKIIIIGIVMLLCLLIVGGTWYYLQMVLNSAMSM